MESNKIENDILIKEMQSIIDQVEMKDNLWMEYN